MDQFLDVNAGDSVAMDVSGNFWKKTPTGDWKFSNS
jgi:hypothetical protein